MPEAEGNIFQYEQVFHSLHIDPQISTAIQFKSVTPVIGLFIHQFSLYAHAFIFPASIFFSPVVAGHLEKAPQGMTVARIRTIPKIVVLCIPVQLPGLAKLYKIQALISHIVYMVFLKAVVGMFAGKNPNLAHTQGLCQYIDKATTQP